MYNLHQFITCPSVCKRCPVCSTGTHQGCSRHVSYSYCKCMAKLFTVWSDVDFVHQHRSSDQSQFRHVQFPNVFKSSNVCIWSESPTVGQSLPDESDRQVRTRLLHQQMMMLQRWQRTTFCFSFFFSSLSFLSEALFHIHCRWQTCQPLSLKACKDNSKLSDREGKTWHDQYASKLYNIYAQKISEDHF